MGLPATIPGRSVYREGAVGATSGWEGQRPADEALRAYFQRGPVAAEMATPPQLRAIQRGMAAHARGDYLTLDHLTPALGRPRRRNRTKAA